MTVKTQKSLSNQHNMLFIFSKESLVPNELYLFTKTPDIMQRLVVSHIF